MEKKKLRKTAKAEFTIMGQTPYGQLKRWFEMERSLEEEQRVRMLPTAEAVVDYFSMLCSYGIETLEELSMAIDLREELDLVAYGNFRSRYRHRTSVLFFDKLFPSTKAIVQQINQPATPAGK